MSPAAVTQTFFDDGLFAAFAEHNGYLGGEPAYRLQRLAAARVFLDDHADLDGWMATSVDARLVELGRRPFAWQLVSFAIVSGRCRADADFLFAKNFGHSVARWVAGLFPNDVDRLRLAADRLGAKSPEVAVREVLPLAVAFTGRPPSSLTVADLDALCAAIDTSPRLTEAMRRGRRGHLFRLRRLLFEADMVDLPAQHRREGGPATRQARLAVIPAPEIRRTLLAYLDFAPPCCDPRRSTSSPAPWRSSVSSSAATTPNCARSPASNAVTSKRSWHGPRPGLVAAATTPPDRSDLTSTPTPRSPSEGSSTTSGHGAGPTRLTAG
jgi:hypothetical protein